MGRGAPAGKGPPTVDAETGQPTPPAGLKSGVNGRTSPREQDPCGDVGMFHEDGGPGRLASSL